MNLKASEKNKCSILIVEDDSAMIRGLKDNFSTAGFEVLTAMDGESGLHEALTKKPHLILLDVMLPKLSGFEICQEIRRAELDMPIIMLTAKGQEEDIVRGLSLGADDYVTKPFGIKELKARVEAFLRRQQKASTTSTFGSCHYDHVSRKLFKNGKEVLLAPKELGVLELFISREGYALTRDTILTSVWHNNILATSRSVDRCISTLRKKIEDNPKQPKHIKSLRDIGYRFEV